MEQTISLVMPIVVVFLGVLISIIGFFLRRCLEKLDEVEKRVNNIGPYTGDVIAAITDFMNNQCDKGKHLEMFYKIEEKIQLLDRHIDKTEGKVELLSETREDLKALRNTLIKHDKQLYVIMNQKEDE